jgi:hypothetical protein
MEETMELTQSLQIVRCLANGTHPQTGVVFAEDSPYQDADVVRALFVAIEALERSEQRLKQKQVLPENAGKPWDVAEDEHFCRIFDSGAGIKELSRQHGRTRGAIQSRLEKLGKMLPKLMH